MIYTSTCVRCGNEFPTQFPPNVKPFVHSGDGNDLLCYANQQECLSDDDDEQPVVYDDTKKQFVGDGKFAVVLKPEQHRLSADLDPKVHGFCQSCLRLAQRDKCNIDAIHTLFDTAREFVLGMLLPYDAQEPQSRCPNAVQDDSEYVAHNNPTMRLLFKHQQLELLRAFQESWLQNVAGLSADVSQQIISECAFCDCEKSDHIGDLTNKQWLAQLENDVFVSALHDVKHVVHNLNRMQSQKRMRVQ